MFQLFLGSIALTNHIDSSICKTVEHFGITDQTQWRRVDNDDIKRLTQVGKQLVDLGIEQ